ncbi:RHS repeat-associated core domain-containing protein, partial [Brevibacillus laterosporus]|uniref:RHS repeat-associated core domain-containing protein n=1 Tax=Brevibacillus laterosporus TaxID=1465 RepID=UPI003D1C3F76
MKDEKQDYYYTNAHADIVEIKDKAGQTLNKYEYDLWGNVESKQEKMLNPFLYAGELYDEESGLIYLRARYYDPNDGRFITEDTYKGQVDNPLSLNRYTYVHNNPVRNVDPTGNCVWDACIGEAAAVTYIAGAVVTLATVALGIETGKALHESRTRADTKPLAVPIENTQNKKKLIPLYHATSNSGAQSILTNGIDVKYGRANLDFGQGFYVTRDAKQAVDWVNSRFGGKGSIMLFTVDPDEMKQFRGLRLWGGKQWEEFVRGNRAGKLLNSYDYVEGPYLANPSALGTNKKLIAKGNQISIST